MIDVSDAPEQRSGELIPDGTFAKLVLSMRAGGSSPPGCETMDNGLFKASKTSDAYMLDCEFTVIAGEFAHRKIFENLITSGGSVDDKGSSKGWNMTKVKVRAMIDSALGLDPKDVGPSNSAKRKLRGFKDLEGIQFYAKIGVEPGSEIIQNGEKTGKFYDPKNQIERIVVPGDAEYVDLAQGKPVAPKPKGQAHLASNASAGASGGGRPAWGGGAAQTAPPPAQGTLPAAPPPGAAPAQDGPAWLRN